MADKSFQIEQFKKNVKEVHKKLTAAYKDREAAIKRLFDSQKEIHKTNILSLQTQASLLFPSEENKPVLYNANFFWAWAWWDFDGNHVSGISETEAFRIAIETMIPTCKAYDGEHSYANETYDFFIYFDEETTVHIREQISTVLKQLYPHHICLISRPMKDKDIQPKKEYILHVECHKHK